MRKLMRGVAVSLLLGVGLWASAARAAGPAGPSGPDPYQAATLSLGQGLVALFPAAEGYVVSVSGREVFIDLAEKHLLRPGMELQVYRPGAEMIHPVNKQLLGTYEETVGYLTLAEVREQYSRGVLGDDAGDVVAGDRVRVSARRLRALLHFSGTAAGIEMAPLAQALIGRGEESGRFQMIDEPKWAPALAALGVTLEQSLADPALLRSLGAGVPADLLLLVRLEEREGRGAVAVTVRSLRTGAVLDEAREPWPVVAAAAPAPALPPATQAPGASPSAAGEPEYITRELANPAYLLAAGDIAGEGHREVLLSDGHRLSLFRWEEKGLVWKGDEDGRPGRRVLDLQAGDIDGDGRLEVLVASVARGAVRTEVRSWREGRFALLGGADGLYLRLASRPGAGAVIYGQRSGIGEALSGRVEEYTWRDGTFERIEGSALPRQVGIFGLASVPAGKSATIFALDRDGFLRSFAPDGTMLWRSGRQYGGAALGVNPMELFGASPQEETLFEEEVRAFQPRIFAESAGEVLSVFVPRNFTSTGIAMPRQRFLGQGEIIQLEGSATDLEEVRRSRAFDGYVADSAVADVDGDGRRDLLFLVIRRSGYLLGEKGKLVLWRAPGIPGRGP